MNGYGETLVHGVPVSQWDSWSEHTQSLWLQDYYRTEEQATYYYDSDYAKVYQMKETVDDYFEDTTDYAKDIYTGATDLGEKALLYGAIGLGLILLLK